MFTNSIHSSIASSLMLSLSFTRTFHGPESWIAQVTCNWVTLSAFNSGWDQRIPVKQSNWAQRKMIVNNGPSTSQFHYIIAWTPHGRDLVSTSVESCIIVFFPSSGVKWWWSQTIPQCLIPFTTSEQVSSPLRKFPAIEEKTEGAFRYDLVRGK